MARRKKRVSTVGKVIYDAGRTAAQARSIAAGANYATRGDPGCPKGAQAVVKKTKGLIPYEVWVSKKCHWI